MRNLQNKFALHFHEWRPQISVDRLPVDALRLPGGGERDSGEQALAHGPYSASQNRSASIKDIQTISCGKRARL